MKKLIIANWKMNPLTEKEAVKLAKASDHPNVVIVAPFPFLSPVKAAVRKAKIAAQDVSASGAATGARTGEVSAGMLRKLGVRYVIIGHSERRRPPAGGGETDAVIAAKLTSALAAGITPVLCVGEPWAIRRKGFTAATAYVKRQLFADLSAIKNFKLKISAKGGSASGGKIPSLLIAYEPIWAISTSAKHQIETPEDAARMATFIHWVLRGTRYKLHVLYGGSVNARNAASFLARPEFSGVLVGGASLKSTEFRKITNLKHQIPNNTEIPISKR